VWDVRVRAKGTAHVATALLARVDVLETFDRKLIDRSLIKVEGFAPLEIREPAMPEQPSELFPDE
jgi:hypothetical protein